jgi:hypothetical protein
MTQDPIYIVSQVSDYAITPAGWKMTITRILEKIWKCLTVEYIDDLRPVGSVDKQIVVFPRLTLCTNASVTPIAATEIK